MRSTVYQMLNVGKKQLLLAFFLVTSLLLLLHILVIGAWNARQTAAHVQESMGIFLYIRDDAVQGGVAILEELTDAGLHAVFFSKEDAFRLLTKKLPNVVTHLEKYGIKNPLPPTIYVTYKNQDEYETIKSIVARHEDAISNLDNLGLSTSFQQQTWRAVKLVTIMHLLISLCVFLTLGVIVMIATVISYIITTLFYRFQSQMLLANLLGGSRNVLLLPFLCIAGIVLVSSRITTVLISVFSTLRLNTLILDLLDVSFIQNYLPEGQILIRLFLELIALLVLARLLTHIHLKRMLSKQAT